jgi:TolA-binding protein
MSLAALALVALPLSAQQRPSASATATVAADSAMTPPMDPSRALEAEVRIALSDLFANRPVPALQRLQWLASTSAATTPATPSSSAMLRDRGDVLFLLAEAQYRLGMDSAFRGNAQAVLSSGPARYAQLLRAQLLLSAYRTGDFARVGSLLQQTPAEDQTRGLGALVAGLAAYQLRNYPEATAKFAAAKAIGSPYVKYAEYMEILTALRTDTSQTAAALPRLEALAQGATGAFADQVRLTAAQLAYQSGAYDRAITFASAVSPNSGLSAGALLTKAWSQYKSKDVAGAGQSFGAFADQYGQLPERDEARLMAAQSLLQLGRTDEAGRLFRLVSDSGRAEAQRLDTKASDKVTDLARALVQARAAGLLFVNDPEMGKTLALEETAGADPQVLASVMTGSAPALPQVDVTRLVTLSDLVQRFTDVQRTVQGDVPGRVLFAPASTNMAPSVFAQRAEAVLAADLDDAIAAHQLRIAVRNDALRLMQIRGLQNAMQGRGDTLAKLIARVDTTDARLARLLRGVDSTENNLKAALVTQVRNVQGGPAYILAVRSDSLRRAGLIPPGLDVEGLVAARADSLIDALPLFLLRDSVRTRLERVRKDLAESRAAIEDADKLFAAARTGQISDTSATLARLKSARISAQSRRTQAEAALVASVSSELSARATELLALLQHDMQAAEFGTATAAFFNAIDQARPAGSGSGSGGANDDANLGTDSGASPSGVATTNKGPATVTHVQSGASTGPSRSAPTSNAGIPPTQKK